MTADLLKPFFKAKGWRPFAFQEETWNAYLAGKSGLLHAPTGQGKTLAVFLGPLAESLASDMPGRVLWITPLRALAADTLRALREPLATLAPHAQIASLQPSAIRSEQARAPVPEQPSC
jgi:ATP-dependent Lhr-like helicase